MLMKCLSLFTLIFTLIKCISGTTVRLANDGPVTVDSPITFTVHISPISIVPTYMYKFTFDDFPEKNQQIFADSPEAFKYSVTFTKKDREEKGKLGPFTARVEVDYCIWGHPYFTEGYARTSFTLSDSLIISVNVNQEGPSPRGESELVVSTAKETNLTALIKDPTGYFDKFNVTYKWQLNSASISDINEKSISHNFSTAQVNNVSVIVTATTEDRKTAKSGSKEIIFVSKDPISNVSVDGKTFVHRDETLNLKLNLIGGSPPFHYCWDIKNTSSDHWDNYDASRSCGKIEDPYFDVRRYFSEKGKYNLTVEVDNDVSNLSRLWSISIYDIEHQAQLSFVLIPVCSIIAAILILMGGIAIHMRQRKELTIEVADFDFQSYEDLMEKTFFERIRENFAHSVKQSFLNPCINGNEYDDLENDHNYNGCDIDRRSTNVRHCNLRFSGEFEDSGVSDVRS